MIMLCMLVGHGPDRWYFSYLIRDSTVLLDFFGDQSRWSVTVIDPFAPSLMEIATDER